MVVRIASFVALALGCSGSGGPAIALPPLPAAETRATLAGPRCSGGQRCECRDAMQVEDELRPEPPLKRFEFRVGPTQNALWVSVDDMVLYKSTERADECFYVDLMPGRHPVQIHGKGDDGLGVVVRVAELSGAGPWWYDTFSFDCGGGGLCDLDGMRGEKARIAQVDRGIHDTCGSVKVQQLDWRTGTMPDALHPGEIVVDFVLNVYRFATEHPPGSDACQ
jgi:hypothetical protein